MSRGTADDFIFQEYRNGRQSDMLQTCGVSAYNVATKGRRRIVNNFDLDSIDWNILAVLQNNSRVSNVELASKVHLSPSPCLARVKALEQGEYISSYVTLLNARAVGLGVSLFVQVRLEKQIEASLNAFEKAIAARPEVMECYLMTGASDYLLRVVVSDLEEFQRFVTDVSKIPGVGNIQSSVALKQVKYKTALPLPSDRSQNRRRRSPSK
jgi:Lrp/AsnC family leucine-responsive transcriptional regulator